MSSSSSTNSSSSSSSLPDLITEKLNQIIAGNNPDDLILFTYSPDDGFNDDNDDNKISFSFRTVNNSFFNYSSLLNPGTPASIESASNCYVPEDKDINIHHDPVFFVDLIVKDSGAKNISVRSQEEKNRDESVKYSFLIPKFTWSDDLIVDAIASNVSYSPLEDADGSLWTGTTDKNINKIEYNSNVASKSFSTGMDSIIRNILTNPDGDEFYITTDETLEKYTISHYMDEDTATQVFVTKEISKKNSSEVMSWYDTNVWSVVPEFGSVKKIDVDTLENDQEILGFDAPFKVIRSDFHNATFIAGTSVLWKYDGSMEAVYSVEGYTIFDFDISKNGMLCISLNGKKDSYFRIVDRNLFRLIKNERIVNGKARFCKFCSNDFFYGLTEVDNGGDQFIAQHHTYNTINGSYNITQSPVAIIEADDTDDPTPATQPIVVEYPNGGENILLGSDVDVTWKSDKSVNDSVKIELYKAGVLEKNITSSTPNTGAYSWKVSSSFDEASDYKIKVSWLANETNTDNEDLSNGNFSLVSEYPSSSENEIPFLGAVGVDYDKQNDQVVIVLESGLVGFLSFDGFTFNGWLDSGVTGCTSMVVKNEYIKVIDEVSKVRIFVGSSPYLSDKWDSGIMETSLNSVYYGGGDNLISGETYYVNIQVYSTSNGWSEVQPKKWIMPKK
jgi:hypothetical protein